MIKKYKEFIKNVALGLSKKLTLFLIYIFPFFIVTDLLRIWVLTIIKVQPLTLLSNIVVNAIFAIIFIYTIFLCLFFYRVIKAYRVIND